jgi:hypothetical protein
LIIKGWMDVLGRPDEVLTLYPRGAQGRTAAKRRFNGRGLLSREKIIVSQNKSGCSREMVAALSSGRRARYSARPTNPVGDTMKKNIKVTVKVNRPKEIVAAAWVAT